MMGADKATLARAVWLAGVADNAACELAGSCAALEVLGVQGMPEVREWVHRAADLLADARVRLAQMRADELIRAGA